jgi:hypothetical protein
MKDVDVSGKRDGLRVVAGPEAEPDVAGLIGELQRCTPFSAGGWNRVKENEDIRFCRWPNQWPDGKKRDSKDKPAFPFDGASDARCPVADDVIVGITAECSNSFWRAWTSPKAGADEVSNYAVKLAEDLVNRVCFEQLVTEVELSSQIRESIGWVVLRPYWEVEVALEYRTIRLEDFVKVANAVMAATLGGGQGMGMEQGQESSSRASGNRLPGPIMEARDVLVDLPRMVADEREDDRTIAVIEFLYEHLASQELKGMRGVAVPKVRRERWKRALAELREGGEARVPMPYVCRNQPGIRALKPWEDVWLAESVTDVQKGRVFLREFMGEAELRSMVASEGWNEGWVNEALKFKGKSSVWGASESGTNPPESLSQAMTAQGSSTSWQLMEMGSKDLVEVWHAIYVQVDEDGVPAAFSTVFHPSIGCEDGDSRQGKSGGLLSPALSSRGGEGVKVQPYAKHGLIEEARGRVPYVVGKRENWNRRITSSRGIPEVVSTWQRAVKVQYDGIADWTSMGVMPPINVYEGAVGTKYKFGPGVQNTVKLGREPKMMEIKGSGVPVAFEFLNRIERDVAKYVGEEHEGLPPQSGSGRRQLYVSSFLLMWSLGIQQLVALAQEYMEDAEFAKVTGAPEGWLDDNRHKHGVLASRLQFDVRELDPEYVKQLLETVNNAVLPQDVAGVTDRAKWTKVQWRMINPALGRELVTDDTTASQKIFTQVQNDIAMMFLGNEPQYVEMDPTAQSKLKFASQIVGANPNYQQGLQAGGRFAELLKKYSENLMFSITQEQNKQVGRIGVQPAGAGPGLPETGVTGRL